MAEVASAGLRPQRRTWVVWGVGGAVLLCLFIITAVLSPRFDYDTDAVGQPTILVTGLLVAAGIVYVCVVASLSRAVGSRSLITFVIVVGALARLVLMLSVPIHEDDFYRYLWDGAVTADGGNPYKYAPSQVADGGDESLRGILASSADAEMTMERINHSELRTIYPPVAQAAFALAHMIRPWNLVALKIVLGMADAITLLLLGALLRRLGLPLIYLVVYWWNPILIKEVYNSAHMDVLVLPFVVGAVLFHLKRGYVRAAGLLALGVGVKVWPILLLPLVLRPVFNKPRYLIPALVTFCLIAAALLVPMYSAGLGDDSGLATYSRSWEMNDALFMVIQQSAGFIIRQTGLSLSDSLAARGIAACILAVFVVWISWRQSGEGIEMLRRGLCIVAALFLLSPVQFPWYYIWMLPFLTIQPRFSLLIMAVLLPLYYLRFYFVSRDMVSIFDNGIVWLEYIPVWLLIIREEMKGRGMFAADTVS